MCVRGNSTNHKVPPRYELINTSGRAAMLQLIRFQCAEIWISTGLPVCVRVCVCVCACWKITNHKVPPRFELITAVFIYMHAFRHITPSRLVYINVLEIRSASTFKLQPSNLVSNSTFRRHYVRNCLLADTAFPATKFESSRRPSSCSFPQPHANHPLVDPNFLVSALFSNTASVLFPDGEC